MGIILSILLMLAAGIVLSFCIAIHLSYGKPVYCTSRRRIDGKVVVITGSCRGIGKVVAVSLAKKGATVYVTCRHERCGLECVHYIRKETLNRNIFYHKLDLADFQSVKCFASYITSAETSLDILINNAAIGATYEDTTKDGSDLIFTTNYLGHFLLTYLLLDLLYKTSASRVVNVSSVAHTLVRKLDLNPSKSVYGDITYRQLRGYDMSKLAMILHVKELTRKINVAGLSLIANAATPGLCLTGLWSQSGTWWPACLATFTRLILRPMALAPEAAAQTLIYCAISEDIGNISGKYFEKCALGRESQVAKDSDLAARLWDLSMLLTGCRPDGKTIHVPPQFQYLDEEEIWTKRVDRWKAEKKGKEKPMLAPENTDPITRS